MQLSGSVVAVTGGGGGLGSALCRAARARGAAGVAVIDRDERAAAAVAAEVDGLAVTANLTSEAGVAGAIEATIAQVGRVDIFISNAGVSGPSDPFTDDAWWEMSWRLHVMSNVHAARHLLPAMLERGRGHLVSTASVNALTTNPVHMAYAVTKHAQLAVAEWLAMTYGSRGIRVTCFCPKGIVTPMLLENATRSPLARQALGSAVTPERAAEVLLDGVEADRFMVTTHPPIWDEVALRSRDYEAYIAALRAVHDDLVPQVGTPPVHPPAD